MTFRKTVCLIVSLVVLSFSIAVAATGPGQDRSRGKTPEEHVSSVLVQSDRPVGRHLFGDWYVVETTAQTESEAVREAKRLPGVIAAEPDARLKLHQTHCPPAEWYVENLGQFGGPDNVGVDTHAWDAWETLHTLPSPTPVRIAVMDSGVDACCHPRFQGVTFYAQKKFADDSRSIGDVYGHGTMVAGVITAMLPDPSWYQMGSYRVFDEYGYTTYSVLIAGLDAAVADESKIINFSGGAPEPSVAMRAFLAAHPDVLFVFSAGNEGGIPDCPECGQRPEYPALYHDLPNVVSVAAIEQSGALTSFTNTGALLAAPGQYIFTSMAGCQPLPITVCQPAGYGFGDGTSFSAPMVSAVCAGRMLMHPQETAAQIRQKLLASVKVSSRYRGKLISSGRVDFEKLVQLP